MFDKCLAWWILKCFFQVCQKSRDVFQKSREENRLYETNSSWQNGVVTLLSSLHPIFKGITLPHFKLVRNSFQSIIFNWIVMLISVCFLSSLSSPAKRLTETRHCSTWYLVSLVNPNLCTSWKPRWNFVLVVNTVAQSWLALVLWSLRSSPTSAVVKITL